MPFFSLLPETLEPQNLLSQSALPLLLALLSLAEWIYFTNYWGERALSKQRILHNADRVDKKLSLCYGRYPLLSYSPNYYNYQVCVRFFFFFLRFLALYNHCPTLLISQITLPTQEPLSLGSKYLSSPIAHRSWPSQSITVVLFSIQVYQALLLEKTHWVIKQHNLLCFKVFSGIKIEIHVTGFFSSRQQSSAIRHWSSSACHSTLGEHHLVTAVVSFDPSMFNEGVGSSATYLLRINMHGVKKHRIAAALQQILLTNGSDGNRSSSSLSWHAANTVLSHRYREMFTISALLVRCALGCFFPPHVRLILGRTDSQMPSLQRIKPLSLCWQNTSKRASLSEQFLKNWSRPAFINSLQGWLGKRTREFILLALSPSQTALH